MESKTPCASDFGSPAVDSTLILCIDDDPDVARAIEIRLRPYKATVLSATYGMQGFYLAMAQQPDLIITDINMPQGNGAYVIDCLKQSFETCEIPIVVLSGRRDDAMKLQLVALGVEACLEKPCRPDELIAAIKKHAILIESEAALKLVPPVAEDYDEQ